MIYIINSNKYNNIIIMSIFKILPPNIIDLIYEFSGNWKDTYNKILPIIHKNFLICMVEKELNYCLNCEKRRERYDSVIYNLLDMDEIKYKLNNKNVKLGFLLHKFMFEYNDNIKEYYKNMNNFNKIIFNMYCYYLIINDSYKEINNYVINNLGYLNYRHFCGVYNCSSIDDSYKPSINITDLFRYL